MTTADQPMERCSRNGHQMIAWPEGIHLMASIADSLFNTEAITEPMQCSTCASLTFVLRRTERIFVPHYQSDKYGKPIRRPIDEPAP